MKSRKSLWASAILAGLSISNSGWAGGHQRCVDCTPPLSCPSSGTISTEPGMVDQVIPQDSAPAPESMPIDDFTSSPGLPFGEVAALGSSSVGLIDAAGGYLENAVIRSRIRLRSDFAYDNNRPDRAEYFYAKCGCFGTNDAKGPERLETNIDSFQEYKLYIEYAPRDWFSFFIEPGLRGINPEQNDNEFGFGDLNAGGRLSLYQCGNTHLTAQLRTYIPTGDGRRGLGTDHVSIEPGLLYYTRIGERIGVQAELIDWIPVDGSHYQGNVLRYGLGVGYDVYRQCGRYVTPIAEFVGWSVLDGEETDAGTPGALPIESASGDTIVNGKLGVRVGNCRQSVYVGYGRALTGEFWYQDIVRLEYRVDF